MEKKYGIFICGEDVIPLGEQFESLKEAQEIGKALLEAETISIIDLEKYNNNEDNYIVRKIARTTKTILL